MTGGHGADSAGVSDLLTLPPDCLPRVGCVGSRGDDGQRDFPACHRPLCQRRHGPHHQAWRCDFGATTSAVSSLSSDPPMLLVCMNFEGAPCGPVRKAGSSGSTSSAKTRVTSPSGSRHPGKSVLPGCGAGSLSGPFRWTTRWTCRPWRQSSTSCRRRTADASRRRVGGLSLDPCWDFLRVGFGLAAQVRRSAFERLVRHSFIGTLEDSGDFGQEIAAPGRWPGRVSLRSGAGRPCAGRRAVERAPPPGAPNVPHPAAQWRPPRRARPVAACSG